LWLVVFWLVLTPLDGANGPLEAGVEKGGEISEDWLHV
jgi:hypothetical protein